LQSGGYLLKGKVWSSTWCSFEGTFCWVSFKPRS